MASFPTLPGKKFHLSESAGRKEPLFVKTFFSSGFWRGPNLLKMIPGSCVSGGVIESMGLPIGSGGPDAGVKKSRFMPQVIVFWMMPSLWNYGGY